MKIIPEKIEFVATYISFWFNKKTSIFMEKTDKESVHENAPNYNIPYVTKDKLSIADVEKLKTKLESKYGSLAEWEYSIHVKYIYIIHEYTMDKDIEVYEENNYNGITKQWDMSNNKIEKTGEIYEVSPALELYTQYPFSLSRKYYRYIGSTINLCLIFLFTDNKYQYILK